MKKAILFAAAVLLLTACYKECDETEKTDPTQEQQETTEVADTARCSVLVYVAGDNNLTGSTGGEDYLLHDVQQMMEGSRSMATNDRLVLFVDQYGKKPYFMQVQNGDTLRLKTMPKELKSSDPETLYEAMKFVTDSFPAKSYGLVLWGHADGWITRGEAASRSDGGTLRSAPRKAYGVDYIGGRTWMNIPDMAKALTRLPKMRFIFADCCAFLCVENAYELRNCADYIIGSAAEIPGEGAPYQTVVPAMFSQQDDFYRQVVDAYYAQTSYGYKVPLAAVETCQLDLLAQATATAMGTFANDIEPDADGCRYPDVDSLIFYYDHTQFDMQDFMLRYASAEQYAEWKKVFDKAVPYHTFAEVWMANHIKFKDLYQTVFSEFTPTVERQSGLGMFVPQRDSDADLWARLYPSYPNYLSNLGVNMSYLNASIKKMQWYQAAQLSDMGW